MKCLNDGLHKVARDFFIEVNGLMKVLDESVLRFEDACYDRHNTSSPWTVGQFLVMAHYF